ncbi:phage tail tape measure protein [Piscibacillus sp. B03]|uniref:phage tail tape measure protein n=1 Tax=Piscibacillus sp. B03 TaxID=3457430 RepID=UPI003FCC73FE
MAERIEGLNIGLDLDTLTLDRGLTGVKDRLKTVNSEMRKNMSAFDRGDRSINKYETRLQGLNKKLEVQKKVTEETYKEYQKMVDEHGEGSKEAEKAERAYNNQAAALNNLERYVQNTTEELEEMRREQAFQESGWGRLTTNLDQFSDKMNNMGDTLTGFGQTMSMRVTAPIVAAGGLALGAADKVEQAYRDIRVGTGATGEALDELEKSFDNVFTSVPDGAEQVAGALANLNTFTGATGSVLEGLTKRVLDVSRLLKEDATQNAQSFGEALKQWQLPAEQGADVLDYMYKLTQDYGIGLGELNSQLTNYGSVLNNAGFEMDEAAHFMASLESNGIAVSRIMPGLNKAFRNWADEGKNSREELENVVETIAETEDKQKALSLATEAFGAEGAQRLMTAIRNRAIPAFDELGEGAEDAKGSIEETADETKTIGEEFAELKNTTMTSLRPVGDILLNLARDHLPPLVDGVTDLAEWFDSLDTSTQKTILSTAGFTAALGPASLMLGTTFKAVGSLTGGLARVTELLGKARGAGLVARLGMLGPAGVAGLAVGGITLLGTAIYGLSQKTKDYNEVNHEKIEKMTEEATATNELLREFESLQEQNRLTSDEMLEYMDILDELKETESPEKIKELSQRQEELEKKSGLSKDEMKRFLDVNEDVVEMAPESAKAISEQGNVYAENAEKVREYTQAQLENEIIQTRSEVFDALENQNRMIEDRNDLETENKRIKEEIEGLQDKEVERYRVFNEEEAKLQDIKQEILDLERDGVEVGSEKWLKLQEQKLEQKKIRDYAAGELSDITNQIAAKEEKLGKNVEEIEYLEEQITLNEQTFDNYQQLILAQEGLNTQQGFGIAQINKKIEKLKEEKDELDRLLGTGQITTEEYERQVGEIDEQITGLKESRGLLDQVNERAALTGFDKQIYTTVDPSIDYINERLQDPITKKLKLDVFDPGYLNWKNFGQLSYAEGTSFHPGGRALVGEEGWELARYKNNWAVLPFGVFDLPRGTQVFTHDESKQLMNALPAYADGVRPPSEFMKLLALLGKERHQPADSYGSSHSTGRESPTNITQHITIQSPEPVSPAEAARLQKKASRELAMELRW